MSILMKGKRKSQSNNGSRSRAKHSSLPLPSHSFFKFTLNKSKGAQRVLVLLGDRHKSRRPSNSLDFLLRFGQAKCQFLRTVKNLHVPQKRSRPAGDRGENKQKRSRLAAECPARRERLSHKNKHFPHFSSPSRSSRLPAQSGRSLVPAYGRQALPTAGRPYLRQAGLTYGRQALPTAGRLAIPSGVPLEASK